jgi:hypothetical protein
VNSEEPHKKTVQFYSPDNKCDDLNLSCPEGMPIKVQFLLTVPRPGKIDGGNKDGGSSPAAPSSGNTSPSPTHLSSQATRLPLPLVGVAIIAL